jgi:RNA polymerase sigma-70 factor, ECF subfamily
MTALPTPDVLATLDRAVRDQREALAGLARREGLGAEDALDCVHDAFCTFLRLAQQGAVPEAAGEHGPLLAGIVVNTARNKRRRHHLARPHAAIDAVEPGDSGPSVESLVAHAEECVRLRGCVERLCRTQRTVVMMRLLEERPGEDVAAALGISRGYVDVLLHRAKASLLVCMTGPRELHDPHDPG